MISQLLGDSRYRVEGAIDGEQALNAIHSAPPDILLLDLLMPKLDGFGVIQKLREQPETSRIPIIILTAKSLTEADAAALKEGIYAIIQKQGLQRKTLLQQIHGAIEKALTG